LGRDAPHRATRPRSRVDLQPELSRRVGRFHGERSGCLCPAGDVAMIPLTSLVDVNSGAAVDPAIATKLFRYQLGPTKIQPHYRVTNFQLQPQSVLPKPKYWKAAWDTSEITRLVMPGSDVASCD